MLDKNQIERIKETKRLELKGWHILKHYYIAIFPLALYLFLIIENGELLKSFGVWFLVLLSIILFFIQRRKLKFEEFKAHITKEDIEEAYRRAAAELEWDTEVLEDNYIQATFKDPMSSFSKNVIIIIPTENGFLINSISDLRESPVPLIRTWDKENIKTFLKHIKDTINKQPENKDYLEPEKQWTLGKILVRVILYPFWLFIIVMSIYMIFTPIWFKSLWAGIGGLVFGIGYFVFDIKNIIKRRKYESTTQANT